MRTGDFGRFAEAMMDEEVIFDPVDATAVRTVARLAREVAGEIGRTQKSAGPEARRDLAFERAGLADLADRLEDLARRGRA